MPRSPPWPLVGGAAASAHLATGRDRRCTGPLSVWTERPTACSTVRLPDPGTCPKGLCSALRPTPRPGPACPRLAEHPGGRVRAPETVVGHACVCAPGGPTAPRCLNPLGNCSWPASQPFWWGPPAFPVRTLSQGWCPRHHLSTVCAFASRMQNCQLVPQTRNLEAGSRALQHAPSSVSADIPGALQALQVGRDPSPGPAQSHVLSATLDLALPLARHALCIRRARLGLWDPCPRQGPWGVGQWWAVPHSQEAASPAAEATDEESSFFSKRKFSL